MTQFRDLAAVGCLAVCFALTPLGSAIAASPEDQQVDQLAMIAMDKKQSLADKTNAIDSIGRIGAESSETVPKLVAILDAGMHQDVVPDEQRPIYLLHAVVAVQKVGPDAIGAVTKLSEVKGFDPTLGPAVDQALDAVFSKKLKTSAAPSAADLKKQLATLAAEMKQPGNAAGVITAMSDVMNQSTDPVQRQVAAQFAWNAIHANSVKPTPQPFLDGLARMLEPLTDANPSDAAKKANLDERIMAAQMFGQSDPPPGNIPKALLVAANDSDPGLKAVAQNALDTIDGKKAAAQTPQTPTPNGSGAGGAKK